jgi:predicted dithiol-disulfide oxidoreductase (DUF899 family)
MKNKQIAEKNDWAAAHESTRKVLEARTLELAKVRDTVTTLRKELPSGKS